jgi:hypothetical protein
MLDVGASSTDNTGAVLPDIVPFDVGSWNNSKGLEDVLFAVIRMAINGTKQDNLP